MAKKFKDMQNQAQSQMRPDQDSQLKAAEKIEKAAEALERISQHQLSMMQNQTKSVAQEIQMRQVEQQMQQQKPPGLRQRAQPYIKAASAGANMARDAAGAYAKMKVQQLNQFTQQMRQDFGQFTGYAGASIDPTGQMNTQYRGAAASAWALMPHNQYHTNPQFTHSQYMRSQGKNIGVGINAHIQGAMRGVADKFSAEAVGSNISLAAMPWWAQIADEALLGGQVGQTIDKYGGQIGRDIDKLNPIQRGLQAIDRANATGAAAGRGSHIFLRGSGQGASRGTFSQIEQAKIGNSIHDMSFIDSTYDTNEITNLQGQFAKSGQFLGVQNAEQYSKRMKKLLDTHKTIMKTIAATSEEAVQMMDQMYSVIGFDHGSEMTEMTTRMYASAMAAGMSPQQMSQVAMQGAQGAGQYGLMNKMGARMAMSSQAIAGQAAAHSMPTDLLASVGGERGLGQMLNRASMRFASGIGGTLMTAGGSYGTDVHKGMRQAAGSFQSSGDLVKYMANRHNQVSDLDPAQLKVQQAQHIMGLAQQMGGVGGSLEDRMKIVAKQQLGLSPMEADAYVQSLKSMPQNLRSQQRMLGQKREDMIKDMMYESTGFGGSTLRIKQGLMNYGGRFVRDAITNTGARAGDAAENLTNRFDDFISGVERRDHYGRSDVKTSMEMLKKQGTFVTKDDDMGGTTTDSDMTRRMRLYKKSGDDFTEDYINEAIESGDMKKLKRIGRAMKSGRRIRNEAELKYHDVDQQVNEGVKSTNKNELLSIVEESSAGSEFKKKMRSKLGAKIQGHKKHVGRKQRIDRFKDAFGIKVIASVAPHEIDYAMGDKNFQKLMQKVQKLFKSYDPRVVVQNDEYRDLEGEVVELYQKVKEDPKVATIVDKLLQREGARITAEGVDFTSTINRRSKYINDKATVNYEEGLFRASDDSKFDVDNMFKGVSESRANEHQVASVERFLQNFSDADLDTTKSLGSQKNSIMGGLRQMDDKVIKKMYQSNDKLANIVAAGAHKLKQGKNLSDKEMQNVIDAMVMGNIDGTTNTLQGQDKINKDLLGAEQLKALQKLDENQQKTAAALEQIVKKLEELD